MRVLSPRPLRSTKVSSRHNSQTFVHHSSAFTGLLETVLFAKIRFHDTVSRGRLLNRFGKDFETIDSNLADSFGRTAIYGLSVTVTVFTVAVVGGFYFLLTVIALAVLYWRAARIYGQTSRDLRRLGE
jgi:ABC-type multidrug transport system fused ATPase/permease subunit